MNSDSLKIFVRWPKTQPSRKADRDCVIGHDLKISPAVLQDFSGKLLKPMEQDLVIIAGAIAFADRVVRRKRAKGWARELEVTLPVSAPSLWNKSDVMTALLDVVEYVSGDHWTFHFVEGGSETLVKGQSSLDFTRGNYVVLPFSDGLDSFLQWRLLKEEEPQTNILRVHTSSRASNRARNRQIDATGDKSDQRLGMPVSLSIGEHAEPTYRTRTFLFFTIAAIAAHKFQTARVVIGENGIGTLCPSMVPFGDECPHRTTHPAFTRRLAVFVNRVLGSRITFEHPQQFLTKGQVLRRAIDFGVTGWEKTHSCTRGARNKLDNKPCGVCGGCLLRRTAILAAGEKDGTYFWDDLSGVTLDDCRSDLSGRAARPSDIDIAEHGIFDMSAFSELSALDTTTDSFARAAWELVGGPSPALAEVEKKIRELAQTHAAEWAAFRAAFDAMGFLNA